MATTGNASPQQKATGEQAVKKRPGFIALVCILLILLVYRSRNLKASHGKVLESPPDFGNMRKSEADTAEYYDLAKSVERIRLFLIAAIFFFGEAMALHFVYLQHRQELKRWVWPWLLENL